MPDPKEPDLKDAWARLLHISRQIDKCKVPGRRLTLLQWMEFNADLKRVLREVKL